MSHVASSSLIVEGRNVITTQVVERPIEARPVSDSITSAIEWLMGDGRYSTSFVNTLDELSWRLLSTGVQLLRVTFRGETLHPQFLGATYVWWRPSGQTREIMITHEVAELIAPAENPVVRVKMGETLRRRMEGEGVELDFAILHDLKASGATDYFALPVDGVYGKCAYMATFATDRPGGFSDLEIASLSTVADRLSFAADMNTQRQIAENVLKAYLGKQTGSKVLAGQIRRGSGEAIAAVLWSSDLRGFTKLSDRLPGEALIGLLNELFDLQAKAISVHGGEILKFIGDGLLAIFPVADPELAARAAENAVSAAKEALSALATLKVPGTTDGKLPEIVIALHYGTVIYGNIGAADRLDFTVIGPAVNLVSRIETAAKSLGKPLVLSDEFAKVYGGPLRSLGPHLLRGLEAAQELFVPCLPE